MEGKEIERKRRRGCWGKEEVVEGGWERKGREGGRGEGGAGESGEGEDRGGAREGKEGGREVWGERREEEEGGGARGGKRREGEGRRREGRERGWGLRARPAPSVPTPASAPSRAAASQRCPASPLQPPLAVRLCRCCHHRCRHSWRGAGPAEPRREPPRVGRALQVSHWAGAGGARTGLGRCAGRWEPPRETEGTQLEPLL